MEGLRVGNAPCSWGTIEHVPGARVGYTQMLDELADTGYEGTELGDWGFMPTDPEQLTDELERRHLTMIGSWVTVRLTDAASHEAGVQHALEVARLLAAVGGEWCTVNIGDDHSSAPHRARYAGRIRAEHGLDREGWETLVRGVHRVAEAVRGETGLRTCLHPHGATYVETPAEVDTFLDRTDPDLVGIILDTGHYMLGGGDPVAAMRRYRERVWLVHFKDFDPQVVERARTEGWAYDRMVGEQVFPELGQGAVDFPAFIDAVREAGYRGWTVVEQDVLPGKGTPRESAARNRDYLRSVGL